MSLLRRTIPRTDAEVDAMLADADRELRQHRPGTFIPAVEYDWAKNAWQVGAKDHKGQWLICTTMGGSLSGGCGMSVYSMMRYFEGLASALRKREEEE